MTQNRGSQTLRSYEEINAKIQKGDAVVMTAEDFTEYAKIHGLSKSAKEVDVVTTGTFGAMCSSGAFLNFGHADPPVKMVNCWLNEVPAYRGLAAMDVYLGATAMSVKEGIEYGGGHVIEDLVNHNQIELRGDAYPTDCYPGKMIDTNFTIDDINQAILLNPRNAYQHYNSATNGSDKVLYTYMGTLLPEFGNVTYSGAGELSPLYKDKHFETIGVGTRIFLGGGVGHIVGEGTQHCPQKQFGTIMVSGDLKQMTPKYLRGATFHKYGATLYVGLGIPIPLINERVAQSAALSDDEITTDILDYSIPSRSRPSVANVSYSQLKSGKVTINNKDVRTSPVSSYIYARDIAETLKHWIGERQFSITRPAELITDHRDAKPLAALKNQEA